MSKLAVVLLGAAGVGSVALVLWLAWATHGLSLAAALAAIPALTSYLREEEPA